MSLVGESSSMELRRGSVEQSNLHTSFEVNEELFLSEVFLDCDKILDCHIKIVTHLLRVKGF
jgi:hypothetical protein